MSLLSQESVEHYSNIKNDIYTARPDEFDSTFVQNNQVNNATFVVFNK